MRNLIFIILIIVSSSCLNNNPQDLLKESQDFFFDNEQKFNEIVIELDRIMYANKETKSSLFIQSKQFNVDYSEKSGDFYEVRNCPVEISNGFIVTANNLEFLDVWMTKEYYKLLLSENYSTKYDTYFLYLRKDTLHNQNFIVEKKLNNNWIIGLKEK